MTDDGVVHLEKRPPLEVLTLAWDQLVPALDPILAELPPEQRTRVLGPLLTMRVAVEELRTARAVHEHPWLACIRDGHDWAPTEYHRGPTPYSAGTYSRRCRRERCTVREVRMAALGPFR